MRAKPILALGLALALLVVAVASSDGVPGINWWVVAGGGGPASAPDGVTLNGTLGQPIIASAGSGAVTLEAGYWSGVAAYRHKIYLPIVLKNA